MFTLYIRQRSQHHHTNRYSISSPHLTALIDCTQNCNAAAKNRTTIMQPYQPNANCVAWRLYSIFRWSIYIYYIYGFMPKTRHRWWFPINISGKGAIELTDGVISLRAATFQTRSDVANCCIRLSGRWTYLSKYFAWKRQELRLMRMRCAVPPSRCR